MRIYLIREHNRPTVRMSLDHPWQDARTGSYHSGNDDCPSAAFQVQRMCKLLEYRCGR